MSKVTRYEYALKGTWDDEYVEMCEDKDGPYVLYSDYAALEAENPIKIYEEEGCAVAACLEQFLATGETRIEAVKNLVQLIQEVTDTNENKIRELEAKHRWIPVSEALPESGEEVIIWNGHYIITAHFGSKFWWGWNHEILTSVTHWRRIDVPEK